MSNLLSRVYAFVATSFEGITDKGGRPYFEHCLAVMNGLPRNSSEELKIAALCHDIIEDVEKGRDKMIALGVPLHVVEWVDNVSKRKGEHYKDYKKRVMSCTESILIKMSDLEHNSDIRRLKGLQPKDLIRTIEYQEFYMELKEITFVRGIFN